MQSKDDDRALIWQIYTELGTMERHFNDLQARYRTLASTWLLAAFGGIGFVLTTEMSFVAVPPALAIAIIGAAAAAGLFLLWILDLLVYHRLLDAAFIEAWRLEEQHAWLPQLHTNMMFLQEKRGVLDRIRLFYAGAFVLMGGISIAALWRWAAAEEGSGGMLAVLAAALFVAAGAFYLLRQTRDTASLREAVGR